MSINWDEVRKNRLSDERHPRWPEGVRAISMEGLALLGLHEKDNKLYWDGEEIVTKRVVSLRWYELTLATLATIGTVGVFLLEAGKVLGWWEKLLR